MWKYLVCILKVKVTIRTLKCTNLFEVENVSNTDGAVLLIRVSYGHTLVVCVIGVHEDLLQTQHTRNRSVEDAAILVFNYVSTMSMNTSRNQSLMSASFMAFNTSAFNTIKPKLLARKLMQLNVSCQIILLDPDLPDRAEAASSLCMDKVRSLWSPGPLGCPFRCFSILYTSDCRSSNNKLIKFSEEFSTVDCDYSWSSESFSDGIWITRQQNVSKIKEGGWSGHYCRAGHTVSGSE